MGAAYVCQEIQNGTQPRPRGDPSVHRQRRAGDEARLVTRQEEDGPGDLLRRADPAQRMLRCPLPLGLLHVAVGSPSLVDHVGPHTARADGVDPDRLGGVVEGHGPGQPQQPGLRRGVGTRAGEADQPHVGCDVDDAALRRAQGGQGELRHQERALQVRVQGRIPLGLRGLLHRPVAVDHPGAVDQDIEAAVGVQRPRHGALTVGRDANVRRDEEGLQLSRDPLSAVLIAADDGDRGALCEKAARRRQANAARPPRDQSDLFCESHGYFLDQLSPTSPARS